MDSRREQKGYINVREMYSAIKAMIEIPKVGRSISPEIDQNIFTDFIQKWIVSEIKDYYKKYSTPISYEYLQARCKKKFTDSEEYLSIIQEVKEQITLKDSEWAVDELKQYSQQQKAVQIFNQGLKDIQNGYTPTKAIEAALNKLSKVDITSTDMELPPPLYDTIDSVWAMPREYIPTKIAGFDQYFYGGFDRRKLTLITASAGIGKTTFSTVLAHNSALQGYNTLHIILEDDEVDIKKKYIAKMVGENPHWVETHQQECREELKKYRSRVGNMFDNLNNCLRLKKLDQLTTTADSIVGYIDKIINTDGWRPDMVIVDYFSALKMSSNQYMSKTDAETRSMRKLEKMAQDYNLVVVVTDQTNRSGIKESGLDNVQGAFTKGQIAANYIEVRKSDDQKVNGTADILIHKVRTGKSGVRLENVIYNNALLYIDVTDKKEYKDDNDKALDEIYD